MKHIVSTVVALLCCISLSYAESLDGYKYQGDDLVSTIGNGQRKNLIVAQPAESYECINAGKNKPLKEGLLFVGSRPFGDKIYMEGDDDVVKNSSYVTVYSKNADALNITATIPFNENYSSTEDIFFITYHSIDPSVYKVEGGYTKISNGALYPIDEKEIENINIGCYYVMAENQSSDYGIGYYWLYATKSKIGRDAQVEITTKYLEDPSRLSNGTDVDSNVYSNTRNHTYFVKQK